MSVGAKDNLSSLKFDIIYRHAINVGDIGLCKWNMDKDQMYIYEKITGYRLNHVKNMREFLNTIAYNKDKDMALQDLEDYMKDRTIFYQSTFRVWTKSKEIKWVLFRGKIFKDKSTGDSVLYVIMFNVTGDKLHEGHDTLTNLINDRFFLRKLKKSIEAAKDGNKQGALILIDIDNFKTLVNSFGLQFGNELLKNFSQSINSLIGENHDLAKFPCDKFIILIDSFNSIEEIEGICNNIYEYFKKPLKVMNNYIHINLSMGVTIFPDDSSDEEELITFCDFAVSESKKAGKNTCTFFNKQLAKAYFRKTLIESELSNAIINNELYLNYQPKMDILQNKITSFEVLLRWNNSRMGFVPPNEFIPIAESKGHIVPIGNWVLEEAIKTACSWKEKGYDFETISVNISPIQLMRKDFKANILNLCTKYNFPPSQLEIEITEGTLMKTREDNIGIIDELIESGFRIAIDDFGIGYSNLNSLLEIKISTLKIDRSIIANIDKYKNMVVLKSIVTLAKNLDFKTIAEGVETKEQFDIIAELGCDIIQGYYFSKPLPENEFEDLLKSFSK